MKAKTCNIQWPRQSPDLKPKRKNKTAFKLLKTKLRLERPTNEKQLMVAAVKSWQSLSREETQSLGLSLTAKDFRATIKNTYVSPSKYF